MKILTRLSIAAMSVLVLYAPQAQARDFGEIYTECGLGAMIAPNNSMVAGITNVTWDLGTTAASSNSSSPGNCKGQKAKVAAFISKSYDDLELEIASGEGKYVDTLSSMTNKNMSNIRAQFSKLLANNAYAKMSKTQKIEKLYNIVMI